MLNGEPRKRIHHRHGVRQGDEPLSPMLFMLAMAPLHMLFCLAQKTVILSYLHHNCANFRMSLYADNAAVFINPTHDGLKTTKYILQLFGEITDLTTNIEKTEFYPIGATI
jgi:hypothetical protein